MSFRIIQNRNLSLLTGLLWLILPALIPGINIGLQAQHLNPDAGSMWLISDYADSTSASVDSTHFTLSSGVFYRANAPALHRTAVKIRAGGSSNGTGAVVSENGLILTSHFVSLQALSRLSSPRNNYIEDGYSAEAPGEEIPLHNYSLLIPIQQRDVTEWVTRRIPNRAPYTDSIRAQRKLHEQLKQKYKQGDPDVVVQIKGIYGGNRQLMVKYRRISDVRLVQVPPASVGQVGGPESYHEWPRYGGGYALLRGYVAPDGSSRPYNQSNKPWNPAKALTIDRDGLSPNTPFISLGYPGTTYRLQSSYAYQYYQKDLNPYIYRSLVDIIDGLEQAAEANPAIALNNWSLRSSMHRSLDYYKGIKDGFERYDIVEQKKTLEDRFRTWVTEDSMRENTYGRVLSELEKSYRIAAQNSPILYTALYTINHNKIMRMLRLYHSYYNYVEHPDSLRFSARERRSTLRRHKQILSRTDVQAQMEMLAELLGNFSQLPDRNQLPYFHVAFDQKNEASFRKSVKQFLARQRDRSLIFDTTLAEKVLSMPPEEVSARGPDSLMQLFDSIYNGFQVGRENHLRHQPYLRPAERYFIEGIHSMRNATYDRPDANSTLRLSIGHVQGVKDTSENVMRSPFTTLSDWMQKGKTQQQSIPDLITTLQQSYQSNGQLSLQNASGNLTANRNGFPTTALTTFDITDGSTGGPIITEQGTLAGLTLENNYAGIIGDFYIDPNQKRAISVDIRYIIALIDRYDSGGYIINSILRE